MLVDAPETMYRGCFWLLLWKDDGVLILAFAFDFLEANLGSMCNRLPSLSGSSLCMMLLVHYKYTARSITGHGRSSAYKSISSCAPSS